MARMLALVVFAVGAVASAEDAGSPTGVLTKAPALLKQVEAVFPPELADAGQGGSVAMEIDIGPDGKVMAVRVTQSAGEAFDRAAVEAARQFEFSPAEVDHQPAPVRIQYTSTFFFRREAVAATVDVDAGVPGGVVNFAGRVVVRGTRDPLHLAQVLVGDGDSAQEVVTDEQGRFELKDVPVGTHQVVVSSPDHLRYVVSEEIVAGRRTEVTYYVRRKVYGAFETVVRAQRERKEVAQVTLTQEEIRLIPGTSGDAFRVVQNLPGVARAPFGLGLLIVRGGKPWDTKTYVDEALVPVLFHFGGLFATFNSSLLEDLSFQAGNFNPDFGRSIGGLVKAQARTPSQKGFHGYFDVNLVDSSALLELPLSESWSVAASARRSYVDALLPVIFSFIPGANDAIKFTVAPRYYDYQARLEWRPPRGRSRFFVSFFGSNDQLVAALPNPSLDPEGRGSFGTSIAYNRLLVGWDTGVGQRTQFRTRTSVGLDAFGFNAGTDLFANAWSWPVLSRNTLTVEVPEVRTTAMAGLDLYVLPYLVDVQSAPSPRLDQIPDPFSSRRLVRERTNVLQVEPGAFLDLLIEPWSPLKLVAGVRVDGDTKMQKAWVDPRASLVWKVSERVSLKGAAGLYHQPPDYRQGQLSEKFGNPNLGPEGARQYMVGAEARLTDAITLDVQLYYKDLFDQVRRPASEGAGADLSRPASEVRFLNSGTGRSLGAEILLRHALTKNFFGWVSYSLSRTERDFLGRWGLAPFDQPHNLIVVASYKLPFDFIVGGRVRYTSGPLTTPWVGAVYDANSNYFIPLPGDFFSRRLPAFFQLDLRVDKRLVFSQWMLAIYLDVQNVTNRGNVEAVLNSYDYTQEAFLTSLPILPVLGVRGEW